MVWSPPLDSEKQSSKDESLRAGNDVRRYSWSVCASQSKGILVQARYPLLCRSVGTIPSVVPRVRHCGIPAILPPMSLKNAPSAGLRAHLENLFFYFSLFSTISVFSVT